VEGEKKEDERNRVRCGKGGERNKTNYKRKGRWEGNA
jgi:hypothetical protein